MVFSLSSTRFLSTFLTMTALVDRLQVAVLITTTFGQRHDVIDLVCGQWYCSLPTVFALT